MMFSRWWPRAPAHETSPVHALRADDLEVTAPTTTSTTAPATIELAAVGRTRGRKNYADLTWTGATTGQVEIRRNDTVVATTANDGSHSDNLGRATGTFRYRVTHPGGTPSSNEVTITF